MKYFLKMSFNSGRISKKNRKEIEKSRKGNHSQTPTEWMRTQVITSIKVRHFGRRIGIFLSNGVVRTEK